MKQYKCVHNAMLVCSAQVLSRLNFKKKLVTVHLLADETF